MNVLITGVAGFIGSHIAERCIEAGHVVFGIDNFDPYYDPARKRLNIRSVDSHTAFRFIEGDIQDPEDVAHVFRAAESQDRSIDVVIHFAAKAGVRPSIEDPVSYTRVNVLGTVNVLEAMVAANTRNLVFASSSSVYGNTQAVPFREDAFVDHPVSPYAATKKSCELMAHSYAHIHRLRIAALRLFTVYGPRQRPDLAITKFSNLIEQGQPLPIYGDGSTTRDYTYIDDIIDGVMASTDWLQRQPESTYSVFNLGGHKQTRLEDLVSALERAWNKSAKIDRHPMQPGDVNHTYADVSKAKRAFGYEPKVSIEEGLKRFVDWAKTHKEYR